MTSKSKTRRQGKTVAPRPAPRGGGGAATHIGITYQDRVSAWFAVRILAEEDATPPHLPATATLDSLQCETDEPVDDLLVEVSGGGRLFAQVKHKLELGKTPNSDLASALDQFVRQRLSLSQSARPLDPDQDRLLLVTTSNSSIPIKEQVPAILTRLRHGVGCKKLSDAAKNKAERDALSVLRKHVARSWQGATGTAPSEEDVCNLLELVRVQLLDLDEGGSDEREAKNLLRSSVLYDPTQADLVWDTLAQACARFAEKKTGADRRALRELLQGAGIRLKGVRNYHNDIERLKQYSDEVAADLSEFASIYVGEKEVKIDRDATRLLRDAAEKDSLTVIGEPGAGKSGVIYDLCRLLVSEGRDVVVLAVDHIEAGSLGSLRDEIRLEHELIDVLHNWTESLPGFLIVDAMDAARSEAIAQTLRDLISRVMRKAGRWHVIASIRKFDLRYDTSLQSLFRGSPPTPLRDPEFPNVRHVNIEKFGIEELKQIPGQSIELGQLLVTAHPDLFGLLTVPFNLRLAGELLGSGASVHSFTPIKTHLDLLDRYWLERVIRGDKEGDAREAVLRRAAERMVAARSLRTSRGGVGNDPAVSRPLGELLRSHVLTEWQSSPDKKADRSTIRFAHHLLFDYAVAKLLLAEPGELVERVGREADVVLTIRPSIVLRFQEEWWKADDERRSFWDLTFRLMRSPDIPELCKLIGPFVAANLTGEISDLRVLIDYLNSEVEENRGVAEPTLRHLVGAIIDTTPNKPLMGAAAPPWCELMEMCSHPMGAQVAHIIRPLLMLVCEHFGEGTTLQQGSAGVTARRLFEFAFEQHGPQGDWLARLSIEAVCQSFVSDPKTSAALIRRCIEPARLREQGYEEMPALAGQVRRLIDLDVELVRDIYESVFTFEEERDDATPMGGVIMGITSNRKQDYDTAQYELAGLYPSFLSKNSVEATRALIKAVDFYTNKEHLSDVQLRTEETFNVRGCVAKIRTDYSSIWDASGTYRSDEVIKMLDEFESHLRKLSENDDKRDERRALIDLVVAENRLAVMWGRLLACATDAPATLGMELRELAWATPILNAFDTSAACCDFIAAVFSCLNHSERQLVEHAILAVQNTEDDDDRYGEERRRADLLLRVPADALVTEEARRLRESLDLATRKVSGANGRAGGGTLTSEVRVEPYTDSEYLANTGVDVKTTANNHVRDLSEPVKRFSESNYDATPTLEEIGNIQPALRALYHTLKTADTDGADPQQHDFGWMYLLKACSKAARNEELVCASDAGAFIRKVLLDAATHPVPVYDPSADAEFDEHVSGAIPAPRAHASEALVKFAIKPSCLDESILDTIQNLSRDDAPAVRYEVAENILHLYHTAPETMWAMLDRFCNEEPRRGILRRLMEHPVKRLAPYHPERVTELTRAVFNRVEGGAGAIEVRKACVSIFNGLYLWQGNQACGTMMNEMATDPAHYSGLVGSVVYDIRHCLRHGLVTPTDESKGAIRGRGFDLLGRILRATREAIDVKQEKLRGSQFSDWTPEEQEETKELLRLADWIGAQVYFASGAFRESGAGSDEEKLGEKERHRFYTEAGAILDDLIELGLPKVAHNLVKLFETVIDFDPRGVLLRIARTVRASKTSGFQYDPMAAGLVVTLMERFLAKYRYILQGCEECRKAVVEILDIFVEPGWPGARRLSYSLDIHR